VHGCDASACPVIDADNEKEKAQRTNGNASGIARAAPVPDLPGAFSGCRKDSVVMISLREDP